MNILRLITQSKPLFSASEWKVAQIVLKSPEEVQRMTIENLAQEAEVSTTTVIRFYKALNQKSFSEFRVQLAMVIAASKTSRNHKKDISDITFKDFEKEDSVKSIANKLFNNTVEAYHGTIDLLSDEIIDEVCGKIHDSSEFFVYGVGFSAVACQNMVQKWNGIGIRISYTADINVLLTMLSTSKKNTTLFLISNSGESSELIYVAKFAKKKGITIITLTESSNNTLLKMSDLQIKTSVSFNGEYRMAETTSLSTQLLIINTLFYRYVNKFEEDYTKLVKETHGTLLDYKKRIRNKGRD